MKSRAFVRTLVDTALAYRAWFAAEAGSYVGNLRAPGKMRDRSLLLLAWDLPPRVSGGVYRPTSFLRYAPENGWRISALSGPVPDTPTEAGLFLLESLPEAQKIERCTPVALTPSYRWFPRIDGSGREFVLAIATFSHARSTRHSSPPSVILASGPPFHNFVAAFYLARSFHAKLVLDYRDEWTENPFGHHDTGRFSRAWERRCLGAADLVLFTTHSQLQHQLKAFPTLTCEKARVLPNGWDPAFFRTKASGSQRATGLDGKILITYTGSLGNHKLPDGFFSALHRIVSKRPDLAKRIRLRFVGIRYPQATRILRDYPHQEMLIILDQVPKDVANRMKQESDALLLCTNPSLARYLPGKLFEYLAAGSPILLYGASGEASRLVSELEAGYVIQEGDDKALELALRDIARHASGTAAARDRSKVESWLCNNSRKKLAERLFTMLDAITGARRGVSRSQS